VSVSFVNTALRFKNISDEDWVLLYLSDKQQIALAKSQGPLLSDPNHPFNLPNGELFKYRRISDKKTFKLTDLPDAYWLLPTQGRSNVHEFNNMREHVRLLAEHMDVDAVNLAFSQKPFDELLDILGASAWESFCFAYLIWEEDFVPTGLSIGRTLPTVDIIGRRRRDGSRIIAQCKKDRTKQAIGSEFRKEADNLSIGDTAFYFAYGGCSEIPDNVRVVGRELVLEWAETGNGLLYKRLLTGNALVN
jgi:hypothetical protein